MHTNFLDRVQAARIAGTAIPAFTCYDLATATGVIAAAEQAQTPVILLLSPATASRPYGLTLARSLSLLAEGAAVPAIVQLDHATDLEVIEAAVAAGAHAVLADGSKGTFRDNVAFVQQVRFRLDGTGTLIEAELGRIDGNEDVARLTRAGSSALTEPSAAADFVRASGADLLAVSVGNVHGRLSGAPRSDLTRLKEITAAVSVPLVLHGTSGLPAQTVAATIGAGVAKINVNTELRQSVFDHLGATINGLRGGLDLDRLLEGWVDAARQVASEVIVSISTTKGELA